MTLLRSLRRALPRPLTPADPFAIHEGDRWIAKIRGPLATLTLTVFLEVLSQAGFSVPHVESFLVLVVAYVAFVDGALPGLASAGLAVLYYGYSISDYGRDYHSPVLAWEDLVVVGSSILGLAILVGFLRVQLERARRGERVARDRLSEVVEGMGAGFFTVDQDGRLDYVNARAMELLGREDRASLKVGFWGAVGATLGAEALERLQRAFRERQEAAFEVRDQRSGAWLDVQAHPLSDGLSVYLADVTERMRAREQAQAVRRLEAIAGLSGGIAHRFNNLLTAIRGYNELTLAALSPEDPARENLLQIREAAERSSDLTRQLLAYARQRPLQPRTLDLNRVLEALQSRIAERVGEGVVVEVEPARDFLPVRMDESGLEEIVLGLAEHGVASMPDGGRLQISTGRTRFDRVEERDDFTIEPGDYALLTVRDDGLGMDEVTRRRVFEPFFSARSDITSDMGPAKVYGVVKQSGGYIAVDSEPGIGTRFRIWLPIATGAAEEPARPRPASGPADPTRPTVLVVEDDEAIRPLAMRALRDAGYEVLEATTGRTALEVVRGYPGRIDLLFTDIVMPEMGGRELARALTVDHPDLTVLYTSGYTDEAMVRGGIARGVLDPDIEFLPKPFTPSDLVAKVREVLGEPAAPEVVVAGHGA